MATVTATAPKLGGEDRFVIPQVDWEGYERIYELCDRKGIRVTYDRGRLELMTPWPIHEQHVTCLSFIVLATCEELSIPCPGGGSTTFRSRAKERGIEPDSCYFLKNLERLRPLTNGPWNSTTDPSPDLAIEVDMTSSSLDRLGIYAALGVGEVWRFNGETLTAHRPLADGSSTTESQNTLFPWLPFEDVVDRVLEYTRPQDLIWKRSIRTWLRDKIGPRRDAFVEGINNP